MLWKITLIITLLAALSLQSAGVDHTPFCTLCMNAQQNVLDFSQQHWNLLLGLLSSVCQIKSTKQLCDYFVLNFGTTIFQNKKKFFETTNYLCSHVLKVCEATHEHYDVERFRDKIASRFPKSANIFRHSNSKFSNSGQNFRVLVLSDIHIQSDYMYKAPKDCGLPGGCCSREDGLIEDPSLQAKYWGTTDAFCDIPEYTFYETVKYIKENVPKVDLIFMLGDNAGHNFFKSDGQLLVNATRIIMDTLKGNFTDTPIVPVLGNHECDHVDYFDFGDQDNFVIKQIYPLYDKVISKDKIDNLAKNGFFSVEFDRFNLKVVSLNSQFNDAFNVASMASSNIFEEILLNLSADLYASEKSGQKVIILSHIPITDYFAIPEINECLKIVLERFRDSVISIFSGHTHADQLRFLRDSEGKVFQTNLIAPSLTTYASHNPSFRVCDFQDGALDDYTQYKFDIGYHNQRADMGLFDFRFEIAYTFKDEYGIAKWNADSMQKLYDGFMNRDPLLVGKYVKNYFCMSSVEDAESKQGFLLCEMSDRLSEVFDCDSYSTNGLVETMFFRTFKKLFMRPVMTPRANRLPF